MGNLVFWEYVVNLHSDSHAFSHTQLTYLGVFFPALLRKSVGMFVIMCFSREHKLISWCPKGDLRFEHHIQSVMRNSGPV